MANENQDPYDQAYWGKAKERNGRKENRNSSIPMMETKAIHSMTVAKEKADMTEENPQRSAATAENLEENVQQNGDPDILEDNWRLTSQANKPMINLRIGKTIFTFADNPLKDEEPGSGSAADRIIDKKGRSTIEPGILHHPQTNQHRYRLP